MTQSRLAVLLLCLLPSVLAGQDSAVQITFLDVGQGDAILVRSPEGRTALIDAGPGADLAPALTRLGVETLDLVVASHPHADHIGGMSQVLQAFPVRFYMDNGQPHTTTTYAAVMQELRQRTEITYIQATPRTIDMGSTKLHILPLPESRGSNLNNASVGLVVEHGSFLAFLSGDSERPELEHFLEAGVVPDVTLLKAPHHGSDDSVSNLFLQTSNPEVVVISVGFGNSFGHPKPSALFAYEGQADQVLRTDRHGEVTIAGHPDGSYDVVMGETMLMRGAEGLSGEPTEWGPGSREPTAQPARPADVSIDVFADAPGNDHNNLNGEYVILTNNSPGSLAIGRWTLCDLARHCFTFPDEAKIQGREQIVLFTGSGRSDGVRFYMGSGGAVWNNRGDTATLYDQEGRVVTSYVY